MACLRLDTSPATRPLYAPFSLLFEHDNDEYLKGNFAIFYMLAKYVSGDIKYIFTKFYRHISTNNEANRKFVILISNLFMGCDVLAP